MLFMSWRRRRLKTHHSDPIGMRFPYLGTNQSLNYWLNLQLGTYPDLVLELSFQDKIYGSRAHQWVREYNESNHVQLKLEKSSPTGFHVLQILGESTVAIHLSLLNDQVISHQGIFAAISKHTSETNISTPKGLKQIIQMTFQSSLTWIEDTIDFVLESVGKVIWYRKEEKESSWVYIALVLFDK